MIPITKLILRMQPYPQDLKRKCDIALKDIKKGEMITCDATKDDISL